MFKDAILKQVRLNGDSSPGGMMSGDEDISQLNMTLLLEKIASENPQELKRILNDHSGLNNDEKNNLLNDLAKSSKLKKRKSQIFDKSRV